MPSIASQPPASFSQPDKSALSSQAAPAVDEASDSALNQIDKAEFAVPPQSDLPKPLRFELPTTQNPGKSKTAKGTIKASGKGSGKADQGVQDSTKVKNKGPAKVTRPQPNPKPETLKAPEAPKQDPDEGIEKPERLSGSKRLPEKEDDALYETYLSLQREVRDDLKASGTLLSDPDKKALILDKLLLRIGQEAFVELPEAHKHQIREFVSQLNFSDLVLAEVQSEGGAEAVDGIVTGTGVDGHYTSSMLHSLQGLIASKRLTPELLGALQQLQKAPLHADLEPQRLTLIRSTLQELAFPERIEQHSKGTCAPTTVQIVLALKDPVKYTQIVTALASPSGQVPAADIHGQTGLKREADTLSDDKSGRSLSSRLLQPALMEFGNGEHNYDNTKDRNSDGKTDYSGLDEHGSIRLLDALFGKGAYALRLTHDNPEPYWEGFVKPEKLMQEVQTALDQGTPVPIGMRWGESGHKVLLTKIDTPANRAYFLNPWGERQSMPLETFKRRMNAASLPLHQGTQISGKQNPDYKEALATLPGKNAQLANYEPISSWRYYKITDYLLEDPALKNLSAERKDLLRDKFRTLKLSSDVAGRQMDVLSKLAHAGLINNKLFERIAAVRDKDELSSLVKLYSTFDKLPTERFNSLLAAEPDQHLDPVWYGMLMDDLDKPEVANPLLARALARQAAVADGSAQTHDQVQAGIRDAFVALTPGDLKGLKPLLTEADEAAKAFMLRKVMDNWPPGQAEDAADLLTADLDSQALKYVQLVLDPTKLAIGSDAAVRFYLRNQTRIAARSHAGDSNV